jgi:hypothetical protein
MENRQSKSNIRTHLGFLYSALERPKSFNARAKLKSIIKYWEKKYNEQ